MNRCLYIFLLVLGFTPLATGDSNLTQTSNGLPIEAQQALFIIDNSQSMTERGFDPGDPLASRWEILKRVYPQWLDRLEKDILVGVVAIGGSCGSKPGLKLPVGTERTVVATALDTIKPDGNTNLNATLKAAPELFPKGVQGSKRIILLSDGLNTCYPDESTCEIVRELHKDHDITVDVVAWVTDPRMIDEFKCVAQASNGTFIAPASIREWVHIPLLGFDPWRYVVLVLGLLTLLLASQILYRQGHHAFGWSTRPAVLSAGILMGLGALTLYIVLFAGAGLGAAVLGAFVLIGALFMMVHNKNAARPVDLNAKSAQWTLLSLIFLTLFIPLKSAATDVPTGSSRKMVLGSPKFHHILALDISGSVTAELWRMKELLARYAETYVLPDEEVSLLAFGYNEKSEVKEICTFTVPKTGSTIILNRSLDDLVIQNPKRTRTYFKPVADALTQFLHHVRLQPVVLVVSDGQSDAFDGPGRGKVDFKEIPFESLGTRGVYKVPGINNWKVAIQGGSGLDLTALFQKPVITSNGKNRTPGPLSPVIDPCLIEPALLVTTEEKITLRPDANPFSNWVKGAVSIRVKNECVSRFRSFRVELNQGNQSVELGSVEHTLIDENPRSFTFPISIPSTSTGAKVREAVVRITLDQGGTARTIYPEKPSVVVVEEIPYWLSFGIYWLILVGASALLTGLFVVVMRRRQVAMRDRPEVVKILGGRGIPMNRHMMATLGGDGCNLVISGAPVGVTLASMEWTGIRGELRLRSENGFRMRINGSEVPNGSIYRLGQPIQFVHPDMGMSYDLTLHSGDAKDIGFGSASSAIDAGSLGGGWKSSDFASSDMFSSNEGFGFSSPSYSGGNGSNSSII